ncbi:hypothetical protein L2E82_13546 [Cichorium intybus]|uniref:Uncharacterized protein n=1 Tax=Cichorium intybus TaxID=13427 RepID=A0ACB9EXB0_CICIN|nr:hypothetical protein L2E82_13546 [Cichorium intybus]
MGSESGYMIQSGKLSQSNNHSKRIVMQGRSAIGRRSSRNMGDDGGFTNVPATPTPEEHSTGVELEAEINAVDEMIFERIYA